MTGTRRESSSGTSRQARSIVVVLAAMALAVAMLTPASAHGHGQSQGVNVETADVLDQMDPENGERDTWQEDGATLRRTSNGISFQIKMPTPEPGEYDYPTEGDAFAGPGHPETYSLWVFVFDDELGGYADFPWSSAFLGGGHVVGGANLTLSGHISTSHEPFAGYELENPRDVEVHLAIAPHGALDPALMPEQITTPTGPGPDIWWVALFDEG